MSICSGHVQHLTEQPSFHVEREPFDVSVPAYVSIKNFCFFLSVQQSTRPTLWSHCHQILYKPLSVSYDENHSLTIPWLFQKLNGNFFDLFLLWNVDDYWIDCHAICSIFSGYSLLVWFVSYFRNMVVEHDRWRRTRTLRTYRERTEQFLFSGNYTLKVTLIQNVPLTELICKKCRFLG